MLKVSASTLTKYKNLAEKAMTRAKAARAQGEEVVERVQRTAISTGAAFGLGLVQGKTGGIEMFGLPLDLLVGAGAHVAGFMKVGGRRSDTLHYIGDGAMAAYAVTMGRSVGANWKKSGKLFGTGIAGELPSAGADYATDEELAAAVLNR